MHTDAVDDEGAEDGTHFSEETDLTVGSCHELLFLDLIVREGVNS